MRLGGINIRPLKRLSAEAGINGPVPVAKMRPVESMGRRSQLAPRCHWRRRVPAIAFSPSGPATNHGVAR